MSRKGSANAHNEKGRRVFLVSVSWQGDRDSRELQNSTIGKFLGRNGGRLIMPLIGLEPAVWYLLARTSSHGF